MAQSTSSGTSSRRHARDHETASISSSRFIDAEWEAKEALRQRELEEARARAAQMEKTMRWWSDCTANWREKWSKVRAERNRARDEAKQLRSKLEAALASAAASAREHNATHAQNEQIRAEIEKIHLVLLRHAGQSEVGRIFEDLATEVGEDWTAAQQLQDSDISSNPDNHSSILAEIRKSSKLSAEESLTNNSFENHTNEEETKTDVENSFISTNEDEENVEEYVLQKLSMMQLRLEEATKTIQVEREEKTQLHRSIEQLQSELQELRDKCEDLRAARQDAVRELLALQDQHRDEVRLIQADLQDETTTRESMDKRLSDLRLELERLQAENAAEWGKRERLETEKLSLERDNKKLRAELRDLQERLERKGRPNTLGNSDAHLRQLQQELADKNKELTDLKHTYNKLKKTLQDKTTELAHAFRRSEQYETEVKRLRTRVEELKRELAAAEDEVDSAKNTIRKLQRTNDELQEQIEGTQVQLEHLNSRLRNSSSTNLLSHRNQTLISGDISDDDVTTESF